MHQAVASTQSSLAPPTISIVISTFNRNFIRNKINYFLQTINTCIQDLSNVFEQKSLTEESKKISLSDKKSLENLRDVFLKLKHDHLQINARDSKETLILDPILNPFFEENNVDILKNEPTFYENRYGFSEAELLNCEFKNPFIISSNLKPKRKNLLNENMNSRFFTNYTQVRGFRTRQSNKETDQETKTKTKRLLVSFRKINISISRVPIKTSTEIELERAQAQAQKPGPNSRIAVHKLSARLSVIMKMTKT